jgi:hypothetical protein
MNTPVKPWSLHRQILWLMGVIGLVLLWLGLFAAFMLQGGFGPGKQTSPRGFATLFGVIFLSACCIYYIAVAQRVWTRRLFWIGVAVHGATVVFLLASGGSPALPFAVLWSSAWIIYARRNTFVEPSA